MVMTPLLRAESAPLSKEMVWQRVAKDQIRGDHPRCAYSNCCARALQDFANFVFPTMVPSVEGEVSRGG